MNFRTLVRYLKAASITLMADVVNRADSFSGAKAKVLVLTWTA